MKCKECARYKFCDAVLFYYGGVYLNDNDNNCFEFVKGTTKDQDDYCNIMRKEEKWKKVLNYQTD